MSDFLDVLGHVAQVTVDTEYYDVITPVESVRVSLKKAILNCTA